MAKGALITGITGQDGAYLSQFLLEKNYRVVGLSRKDQEPDRKRLQYLKIDEKVEIVKADLLDRKSLVAVIEKYQPDEIYHLAAQSSVGKSFVAPEETLHFNIISALNLLEVVRKVNPQIRFYHASSSEMFGRVAPEDLPVNEQTPLRPISPYAISKLAAHWITVNYREAYDLFTVSGILFNHESVLRGPHFVTKKILREAVRIKKGLAGELKLGNLNVYRDWGYAPAYVEAMWLMLQQEKPTNYLICSGEAHSLEEFGRKVFEVLNLDFERFVSIDQSLFRPLELEIIYGNNTRAKKELGWRYSLSFNSLIETLTREEMLFQEWEESLNER